MNEQKTGIVNESYQALMDILDKNNEDFNGGYISERSYNENSFVQKSIQKYYKGVN